MDCRYVEYVEGIIDSRKESGKSGVKPISKYGQDMMVGQGRAT